MQQKPTLVIMAAGMGSRYGGLKQIDPVGPGGEIIMEYSVYDAVRAGFGRAVIILGRDMEKDFRETIGKRIERQIETVYAVQSLDMLPAGYTVPSGRTKPWGTGHAVLCAKPYINGPFAVINADDFYGRSAFETLAAQLMSPARGPVHQYCMAAFILENTLTENGSVARGVCSVDKSGNLAGISEHTRIHIEDGRIVSRGGGAEEVLDPATPVSMNCWGFEERFLPELEARFCAFLEANRENPLTVEYFLPVVVDGLIREGKAQVKVLFSRDKWYGVTYREDRARVQKALADMTRAGLYPERL